MQTSTGTVAPPRGMARESLLIRSQDQLDELAAEVAGNLHRRHAGFEIEVADMDGAERRRWQARLQRGYFACGCAAATVGGFAALAGWLGYRIVVAGGIGALRWTDAALALLAFVVGTGLGKAVGRRQARSRLLHTIDQLRERVPAGASGPAPWPPAQCGFGSGRHDRGDAP